MKVIIENKEIKVESPYNRDFIARAKQIQGRWSSPYWIFPEENREEIKELLIECYGECDILYNSSDELNTVTLEINLDKYREEKGELKLGSMVLLSRPLRDRSVSFAPNVMLIKGGFAKSGGSWKNPRLQANAGTIIRAKKFQKSSTAKLRIAKA